MNIPAIMVFEDDSFELIDVTLNGNAVEVTSKNLIRPNQSILIRLVSKEGIYKELNCISKNKNILEIK